MFLELLNDSVKSQPLKSCPCTLHYLRKRGGHNLVAQFKKSFKLSEWYRTKLVGELMVPSSSQSKIQGSGPTSAWLLGSFYFDFSRLLNNSLIMSLEQSDVRTPKSTKHVQPVEWCKPQDEVKSIQLKIQTSLLNSEVDPRSRSNSSK